LNTVRRGVARYRALREAGDTDGAIALLRSIVPSIKEPKRKTKFACMLVECFAENEQWHQALDTLRMAYEIAPDEPRSRAWLAWAQSKIAWFHGSFETAEELVQETIHQILLIRSRTVEDDELLALSYLHLAHCRHAFRRGTRAAPCRIIT
jgi:hypothetical protein